MDMGTRLKVITTLIPVLLVLDGTSINTTLSVLLNLNWSIQL